MNATSSLMITTLVTSTGQNIYYTDWSVLYWFLGILIIINILLVFKKR